MGLSKRLNRLPVVEDERVLGIEALDMVEDAGFQPVEVMSVHDAIRLLEQRSDVRIVYMDLDLPRGINGIAVVAAIRDAGHRSRLS